MEMDISGRIDAWVSLYPLKYMNSSIVDGCVKALEFSVLSVSNQSARNREQTDSLHVSSGHPQRRVASPAQQADNHCNRLRRLRIVRRKLTHLPGPVASTAFGAFSARASFLFGQHSNHVGAQKRNFQHPSALTCCVPRTSRRIAANAAERPDLQRFPRRS